MLTQKDIFEDQRLVILRLLNECMSYTANCSLVNTGLDNVGHTASRDVVRNHINWLAEQGLVKVETFAASSLLATLTERGMDVAQGRAVVAGVKRPRAGA